VPQHHPTQPAVDEPLGELEVVHLFSDADPERLVSVQSIVVDPADRGFDRQVALPTTYLNDVRFDLRRGDAGTAYITDSSDSGPNGIIVVDLATGASWRRLHEHAATKAVAPPDLRMVVEGLDVIERAEDATTSPISMGRRRDRDRR
jgi:hypothetical protein